MCDCLNSAPQFSLQIHKLGFIARSRNPKFAKCLVPGHKRISFSINTVRNRSAIPFPSDEHENEDLTFSEVMEKGNIGEIRLKRVQKGNNNALEMAGPSAKGGVDESSEDCGEIGARDKSVEENPILEELEVDSRRRGRKMTTRRSNVMAKQAISIGSALSLGFVSQLWVNTSSWIVMVVEVKPSLLSGDFERFPLKEIKQVGDVILVEDENVIDDIKFVGLETLVGYNVVTPSRQTIGKVRDYSFNINSGTVEFLELDSFGVSIVPSSLVSTYALFVEDVIGVSSDTVFVHEARVQRLTKGLWNGQMKGVPFISNVNDRQFEERELDTRGKQEDRDADYRYTEKQHRKLSGGGKSGPRKTGRRTTSADDLELPMDFL